MWRLRHAGGEAERLCQHEDRVGAKPSLTKHQTFTILSLDYPVQSSAGPEEAVTFISLNRTVNGSGGRSGHLPRNPAVCKQVGIQPPAVVPPRCRGSAPTLRVSGRPGRDIPLLLLCSLSFQPSVCFAYYLETDDSDSDSQSDSDTSKPGSSCASPSKPGADQEDVQVWECPLCCLSVLCLS